MNDEEQFRELVDRWDDLHEQGKDVSVEELCRDFPHLEDRLRKWVRLLRATDWLCKPLAAADGPTERFDEEINKDEEVPHITAAEFLKNLAESKLLPSTEIEGLATATDGNALAAQLVQQAKLTQYQADCICRGKAEHLVLGEYTILDVLGSGGMGRVFRALHRRLNRLVALKVLPPSAMDCAESVERFQREIQTVAKLSHPNIVAAHDAGACDGMHYFVMDLAEGQDLAQCVKEHGPLPVKEAIDCILQVARGLEYAHRRGVIHRDIKPSNLILDESGTVKILDLGVARFRGGPMASTLTNTGCLLGTVDYMAPEQAINTKLADQRADIYSLGCTLYFLLTGQPLFGGETAMERLLAHREKEVPSLTNAPKWLNAVFQTMVAKKPEARFQTMGDVIANLAQQRNAEGLVCPPAKTRWQVPALIAVGVAVLLGLGVYVFMSNGKPAATVAPEDATKVKRVDSGERPINLLEIVDPARDTIQGEWKRVGTTLENGSVPTCTLKIPYSPPSNYTFTAVVERKNRKRGLSLGLVVGRTTCIVRVAYEHDLGQHSTAIERIDQRDYKANGTAVEGDVFVTGGPHTIECTVRTLPHDEVAVVVQVDGKRITEWQGASSRLTGGKERWLWVETRARESVFVISKLELREEGELR